MEIQNKIQKEIEYNYSPNFKLGEYLYLGMGVSIFNPKKKIILSVAYKIDYALRKGLENVEYTKYVIFEYIRKIKIGETKSCDKFYIDGEH